MSEGAWPAAMNVRGSSMHGYIGPFRGMLAHLSMNGIEAAAMSVGPYAAAWADHAAICSLVDMRESGPAANDELEGVQP